MDADRNLFDLLIEKHSVALTEISCFCKLCSCHPNPLIKEKNIGGNRILNFFQEKIMPHIEVEESVIFPFLEMHVPKLEPPISLLKGEHEDFKTNAKNYSQICQKRSKATFEEIVAAETYLIYLVRNHLHAEQMIYQIAKKELQLTEVMNLEEKVLDFFRRSLLKGGEGETFGGNRIQNLI